MIRWLALGLLGFFAIAALPLRAQDTTATDEAIRPAGEATLEDFLWIARPLVVFADNPADPRYVQQMQLITERLDALVDRDVVVLTDTDPSARSPIRRELRPRGFMFVLLAKDGTVIIRKPAPWDVREISRSIDKQPLRQQEVRDRRDTLRQPEPEQPTQ
ncbi:DUF4174 domain-containing protein [Salipiger mucosus]|uniref:Methylmalonyl-CoA epimerase n=1 Tax=Salipiger mucosus DSM 16094 TaxID=1123237 RepID=S9R000_9RHOB|nr:DUF4174 domain-containing protein [Salipiger mucosus]EPX85167.1 Methylmalonyl-CoA epimerase [Salipiger mucosus DSM 16094]